MDVYSFGLLCLWLLFADDFLQQAISQGKNISFDALPANAPLSTLETWKSTGELSRFAEEFIGQTLPTSETHKQDLRRFFQETLAPKHEDRTMDMRNLLLLLAPDLYAVLSPRS